MLLPKEAWNIGRFTNSENTRYGIAGIYVAREAERCVAIATDGKRLYMVPWQDKAEKPGVKKRRDKAEKPDAGKWSKERTAVPDYKAVFTKAVWSLAGKLAFGHARSSILLCEADHRLIVLDREEDELATIGGPLIQKPFPNYREIIPSYEASESRQYGVDGFFCEEILHALGEYGGDCKRVTITIPNDSMKPCRFDAVSENGVESVAVLMPVRLASGGD